MDIESEIKIFTRICFTILASYFVIHWFFQTLFSKQKVKVFCIGDVLYLKDEQKFAIIKSVNQQLEEIVIEYATYATKKCNYYHLLSNASNFSEPNQNFASIQINFEVPPKIAPLISEELISNLVNGWSKPYLARKETARIRHPNKYQKELQIVIPMNTEEGPQMLKIVQLLQYDISSHIDFFIGTNRSPKSFTEEQNQIEEAFATLKLHLYHGLLGEVVPSLKVITLNWQPNETCAELIFYHNIQVTEPITFHNGCIEVEASSSGMPSWEGIELGFKVKSLFLPNSQPIPQATQTLFAYQNEGISPRQVAPFWSPNWHMQANLLLKTNEALVGRLPEKLRLLALNWQPESNSATFKFYHVGEISSQQEENYLEIYTLICSVPFKHQGEPLQFNIETHSITKEEPLPKEGITRYLYQRAEPFKDPID